MTPRSTARSRVGVSRHRRLLQAGAAAALLLVAACSRTQAGEDSGFPAAAQAQPSLSDAPLADPQAELLALAFRAASAMPHDPHIKDRSRAQEAVVAACLELDQPQRALAFIGRIENWRRGTAWADLAFHCVQRSGPADAPADVREWLELAAEVARTAEDESVEDSHAQGWRRDRIKARIARTWVLLGDEERAASFGADLAASETAELAAARAQLLDPAAFDARMKAVNAAVATGSFDQVREGLVVCAEFFDRFYADPARRALLEQTIRNSWKHVPLGIRMDLLLTLAASARDHGDRDAASGFLTEAQELFDAARWTPEERMSWLARLAVARSRAGEAERARADIAAALSFFEAERPRIPDIFRAEALCPVAEACQELGDTPAALELYRRAVEEGALNPNARPRAEDLAATCCSMAVHGVAPDAALRDRMLAIADGLAAPW